ncbi:MAG: hypothetical protein CVV30_04865 [Methanomicrobiales archaeon HGW-Methanomicrobiales-1]|jgi:hypothetical protein|nr:MAG: hypothetical protein CVV30_04865 [Methanomicrobiales archaeon HGW-Methanomicrobiales-1]
MHPALMTSVTQSSKHIVGQGQFRFIYVLSNAPGNKNGEMIPVKYSVMDFPVKILADDGANFF